MPENPPTLRDLYPDLSEAELKEAEENVNRYLELIFRIYNRIVSERSDIHSGDLDGE